MKKTLIIAISLFYLSIAASLGQPIAINQDSVQLKKQVSSLFSIETPEYKQQITSPQVALINQYGDYPVDLSKGLIDISVPIYEIKTKNLSLPIHINFHPSGLKVSERESFLGIRWALNAGGVVSRKIKGLTDEGVFAGSTNFAGRVNTPNYIPDFVTLYGTTFNYDTRNNSAFNRDLYWTFEDGTLNGVIGSYVDTQYDIFSYTLPTGRSGKFLLKDDQGLKTPVTMPYEPLKIELFKEPGSNYNRVCITDENGIMYNFGKRIDTSGISYVEYDNNNSSWAAAPVAWHLNTIISPDKQDTIFIEYKSLKFSNPVRTRITQKVTDSFEYQGDFCSSCYSEGPSPLYDLVDSEVLSRSFDEQYLDENSINQVFYGISKITFRGGIVKFEYKTEETVIGINTIQHDYLEFIEVRDLNGNGIKRANFEFVTSNYSRFLNAVKFVDFLNPMTLNSHDYFFDYYNLDNMPDSGDIINHSDWWGYYSQGRSQLLAENNIYMAQTGSDGSSHARYESINGASDKSSSPTDMKTGMIRSIQYPTGGKSVFEYESNFYKSVLDDKKTPCGGLRIVSVENISELGKTTVKKNYTYSPLEDGCGQMPAYYQPPAKNLFSEERFIIYLNSQYPTNPFLYYADDAQYIRRIYSNIYPSQFMDFQSGIVSYNHVIEYISSNTDHSAGKIEYEYTLEIPDYQRYNYDDGTFKYMNTTNTKSDIHVNPTRYGEGNRLIKKSIYEKGKASPIEEHIYNYTPLDKEVLYDLPVKQNWYYIINNTQNVWPNNDEKELQLVYKDLSKSFSYVNQEFKIGATRLTQEVINKYTDQGKISTIRNMVYDSLYLFTVKEEITNSTNKISTTFYKYPFDYPSVSVLSGMVSLHILSPIIEKSIYIDNSFQEKRVTNYNFWHSKFYTPLDIQYQQNNSPAKTLINYHNYDNYTNPIYITKEGTAKLVYLWGYNGQYPIAEIQNATYEQVKSALGVTPESLSSALEPKMDAINGLREKLPQAQVTTYTYSPLIGITSVTDPRGQVTKYIYDRVGRLGVILLSEDGRDKIIKNYHYEMPGYVHLKDPGSGGETDPKPEPIDPNPEPSLSPDPYKKGKTSSVLINIGAKGEGSYGLTGWNYDTQKVEVSNVITKTYKTIEASEYQWTTENLRLKYGVYGNVNMTWLNLTQADVDKYANEYLNGQKIPLEEFEQIFGTWATLYPTAMMYRNIYWGVPTGPGTFDHTWGLPTKEDIWQLYGQAPRSTGNVYEDIKDFLFASACDNKYNWTQNMFNRRNISGLTLTPLGMRESNQGGAIYGFGQVASLQTIADANIETLSDRDLSGKSGIISNGYSYHLTQARHRRPMTDQELGYKMYIDAASDQILMLPYNQASSLPELAKSLERGIALRYANREHLKVLKKWSEIQAEAIEIKTKLAPTNYPAPPALLPCEKEPEPEVTPDPYTKGKESAVLINIGAKGDGSYNLTGWNYDTKKVELNNVITKTYKTIEASEYQWTTENLRLKYGVYGSVNMNWVNFTQANVDKYSADYLGGRSIPLDEFEQVYGTWATLYETAMMYRNIYWGVPTGPGTFDHTWGLPSKEDIWQMYGQAPRISDNLYNDIKDFLFASSSDFNFGWTQGLFKNKNTSGLTLTPLGMRESYNGGAIYGFGQVTSLQTSVRKGIETLSDRDLSTNSGLISNPDSYHFTQARHRRPLTDQELGYKMYIDAANDQVLMLPYDQVSTLPELPKGLERGVALRYANRKALKVVKKWSEIQAEAAQIMSTITKTS